MNVLDALTSVVGSLSSWVETGVGKDLETFIASSTPGFRSIFINWAGREYSGNYIDGKPETRVDTVNMWMVTPEVLTSKPTIEQIEDVVTQIEDNDTFLDGTKKTIVVNSITPIVDSINDIVQFDLSIWG